MARLTELDRIIKAKGIKKKALADQLGITKQAFYNKMSGRSTFNVNEAIVLIKLLGIDGNIENIFLP